MAAISLADLVAVLTLKTLIAIIVEMAFDGRDGCNSPNGCIGHHGCNGHKGYEDHNGYAGLFDKLDLS